MSAQPASQEKKYFVGVGGEQQGPFSEDEIWEKIASKEIEDTTPIWFEGLTDWQTLAGVAPFNQPRDKKNAPSVGRAKPQKQAETEEDAGEDEAFVNSFDEPVFGKNESTFAKRSLFERYGKQIVVGSVSFLFLAALYYIFLTGGDLLESVNSLPKLRKPAPAVETRETRVRKALSELLLSPQNSVPVLRQAWSENATDSLGTQSFAALIEYYENRSPSEAGTLYVENGQPEEAIRFFLMEPPNYVEAAAAMSKAAEKQTDPNKKKALLLDEIKMLIGPANQLEAALQKLKVFSEKYPSEPHPYQYYLKTDNEKIQDLFNRISFFFVESLLGYLDTEFKQTKLQNRPKLEIRKDANEKYRIVGSYRGDILLNRDRLTDIKLTFWLVKEQWLLVETNLTEERAKWARAEKERQKATSLSSKEMLGYLETVFKTQFPKSSLHERPPTKTNKNID